MGPLNSKLMGFKKTTTSFGAAEFIPSPQATIVTFNN